jgi:tetratricopeptide (TPR) repeat protein
MPTVHAVKTPDRRLDSWKEIATFFGRDERTVKRWEKERALPVHRLPGGSRARVFALTSELSQWMHSLDASPETVNPGTPDSPGPPLAQPINPSVLAPITARSLASEAGASPGNSRKRWRAIVPASLLLAILATGLILVIAHRRHVLAAASEKLPSDGLPAKALPTPAVDPVAQALYLKGRYFWNRRTPADLTRALDFFTQSIVRDPNYAQPYVGLADCYNLLREFTAMPSEEAFPRALAAAKKAVELDDSSAEAHASLAFVMFYWNWDIAGAEREFRRAIELNPNYVAAHHWYATYLMLIGRLPEAMNEIERAQQLDPASTAILADKALVLFHTGRTDEASALLKQIEGSQPAFFSIHKYLSHIYLSKRDYPDYLTEAAEAARLLQDKREVVIVRSGEQGFKAGGERRMLENILQVQKKFYAEGQLSPYLIARTSALLGQEKEALQYLQDSYRKHDSSLLSLRADEALVSLHNDPSFQRLVAQVELPPLP